MNQLRIIFMGTPEFAVPSLQTLVDSGFNVVAVVTAPDKPKGRGQKLSVSPVKACAQKNNLPLLQPANLKAPAFIDELKSYDANLQVVVAFRMLPETVWAMPKLGTFNLHASLLPQYRGAAPIHWAVINGEKETGVTTFFLKHEIDTGSIIFQEKETIAESDTTGALYDRLMQKGASLVLKTVRAIEKGEYPSLPQEDGRDIKHAPKIFKETCQINWDQPSKKIVDFVRGLNPFPSAWTTFNGKTFKIHKASVADSNSGSSEAFLTDNKSFLHCKTVDGWVSVDELQPEGKKNMTIGNFLMGNKL